MKVAFTINGRAYQLDVPGGRRLLDVLREDLGLTGTKEGCGEGECGACSILFNGQVVNSCLIPVAQADGADIMTVEGLEAGGGLPLQEAFVTVGAAQCGLCTPGMLISAYGHYLSCKARGDNPNDRDGIRRALAGNLCRCTGYQKIVDAVAQGYEALEAAPRADSQGVSDQSDAASPRSGESS